MTVALHIELIDLTMDKRVDVFSMQPCIDDKICLNMPSGCHGGTVHFAPWQIRTTFKV